MADLHKLSAADLRGFDAAKSRETQTEISRELAKIRMDVYTARNLHTGKIRGLRKSLARLLTIESEKLLAAGPKAPAAPKAAKVAAPKAAKAKAPKVEAKASKADKAPKAAAKAVVAPKKSKTAK